MKTLARITAIALIAVGLLIVTAVGQGLYLLNNLGEKPAAPPPPPATTPAPRKVARK